MGESEGRIKARKDALVESPLSLPKSPLPRDLKGQENHKSLSSHTPLWTPFPLGQCSVGEEVRTQQTSGLWKEVQFL